MAVRPGPDEQALWARVAATIKPLRGRVAAPDTNLDPRSSRAKSRDVVQAAPAERVSTSLDTSGKDKKLAPDTLDGGWDRRLRQGVVAPDRTIDLHGHTLASAHGALDHALERAIADEARVLLVVTGRPPREGETRRGLIRAGIGDWLAASRHAGRIAAVRNAHPRHGGAGALYLILRRKRAPGG